jgi:hypothetical protein
LVCDVIHRGKETGGEQKETKMTTLKNMILSISAVALSGASGLYAQTQVTAEIPFEFSVLNTTLPAGAYTMQSMSSVSGVMLIRNVESRKAITVLAPSNFSEYKAAQKKNVVLFHQIGDRYFLAEVKTDWLCGHVGPSKLERELKSETDGQPVASVIIPALSVR